MGFYVFWLASAARANSVALAATRLMLAEEQRTTALGSLATAAAHKLGSPLNTLTLIAHELNRELAETDPHFEDIRLLQSELERCRVILSELDGDASRADAQAASAMPLSHIVRNMLAQRPDPMKVETRIHLVDKRRGSWQSRWWCRCWNCAGHWTRCWIMRLILQTALSLDLSWTEAEIILLVADDGPGFKVSHAGRRRSARPARPVARGRMRIAASACFWCAPLCASWAGRPDSIIASRGGAVVELRLLRQRPRRGEQPALTRIF